MKAIVGRAGVLAAVFVAVAVGSARAETVSVNVPFPFVVEGKTLPAGPYEVRTDGPVLFVQGMHRHMGGVFVMSEPASGHDPRGDEPVLVFNKYENQYRLSQIWDSSDDGFALHVTNRKVVKSADFEPFGGGTTAIVRALTLK